MADDDVIKFDINSLTFDEGIILEDVGGISGDKFDRLARGDMEGVSMMRLGKAITYIMRRRVNPEYTLDDAGREPVASIGGIDIGAETLSPSDGDD